MDPLSQGSLGAALAQSGSNPAKIKAATLLGCFGGLAPDLDVFIFSPTDPLLFLEFHRQFTHSLVFIPLGALLVATILHRFLGKGLRFRESYLFCLLGYATHGLLDTCTTYGTQLLSHTCAHSQCLKHAPDNIVDHAVQYFVHDLKHLAEAPQPNT